MCHCFYDFGGSCPLKRSKISIRPKPIPKKQGSLLCKPPCPPPPHNRSSSFLTDGATFHEPRCPHLLGHGCKIPGCINEGPLRRRGNESAGIEDGAHRGQLGGRGCRVSAHLGQRGLGCASGVPLRLTGWETLSSHCNHSLKRETCL